MKVMAVYEKQTTYLGDQIDHWMSGILAYTNTTLSQFTLLDCIGNHAICSNSFLVERPVNTNVIVEELV